MLRRLAPAFVKHDHGAVFVDDRGRVADVDLRSATFCEKLRTDPETNCQSRSLYISKTDVVPCCRIWAEQGRIQALPRAVETLRHIRPRMGQETIEGSTVPKASKDGRKPAPLTSRSRCADRCASPSSYSRRCRPSLGCSSGGPRRGR
jgi:hypothetical protein